MQHKKILTAVFILMSSLLLLVGCGGDNDLPKPALTVVHDGLNERIITRLYEYEGTLFAGTDQGLFIKSNATTGWESAGLTEREILDIVIFEEDHYLASVRHVENELPVFNLVETTDAGETWAVVAHNFGGVDGEEPVYGLHYDTDNNAIYATGVEVLASSLDEGRTWQILSGEWQGFGQRKTIVKRNPATNEIWYGGQNALEQLVLRSYSLDTEEERYFTDLLPSPSVIYGIQFDPTDESRILVSGEGGVLESVDNGENWTTLIGDVDYRFYFDVALDPNDPDTLYTGGWDKNWDTPQPLIFEMSTDGGKTWEKHEYPSNTLFGGVRSLIAVEEANKTVVYLGLYRGGVMKVTVF